MITFKRKLCEEAEQSIKKKIKENHQYFIDEEKDGLFLSISRKLDRITDNIIVRYILYHSIQRVLYLSDKGENNGVINQILNEATRNLFLKNTSMFLLGFTFIKFRKEWIYRIIQKEFIIIYSFFNKNTFFPEKIFYESKKTFLKHYEKNPLLINYENVTLEGFIASYCFIQSIEKIGIFLNALYSDEYYSFLMDWSRSRGLNNIHPSLNAINMALYASGKVYHIVSPENRISLVPEPYEYKNPILLKIMQFCYEKSFVIQDEFIKLGEDFKYSDISALCQQSLFVPKHTTASKTQKCIMIREFVRLVKENNYAFFAWIIYMFFDKRDFSINDRLLLNFYPFDSPYPEEHWLALHHVINRNILEQNNNIHLKKFMDDLLILIKS